MASDQSPAWLAPLLAVLTPLSIGGYTLVKFLSDRAAAARGDRQTAARTEQEDLRLQRAAQDARNNEEIKRLYAEAAEYRKQIGELEDDLEKARLDARRGWDLARESHWHWREMVHTANGRIHAAFSAGKQSLGNPDMLPPPPFALVPPLESLPGLSPEQYPKRN